MNLDQLKSMFPDENACRNFFETIIWQNGRLGNLFSVHRTVTLLLILEKGSEFSVAFFGQFIPYLLGN